MSGPQVTWDTPKQQAPQVTWDEDRPAASPIAPPPLAKPNVNMKRLRLIGGTSANPDTERPLLESIGELGGHALQSSPNALTIGHRLTQRTGLMKPGDLYPNELKTEQIPAAAAATFFGMGAEPGAEPAPIARPRAAVEPRPIEAPAPAESGPGLLSRIKDVAVRRASHIPGVQGVKDANYILRGPSESPAKPAAPAAVAKPTAAPIPETEGIPWGSGGQGPIELRGKMIPSPSAAAAEPEPIPTKAPGEAGSMAESVAAPKPIAKPTANAQPERLGTLLKEQPQGTPFVGQPLPVGQRLGDLLNESMGGRVPQGHTPVKSSAILSYKYDPVSREFEATTKSGHYVTGDVSPEQFEQFKSADSKGKAWNQLRQNGTPIAKVVNGQRIAVKPPVSLRSATPDDLTPTLQESLKDALAKKKARIAKAN